MTVNTKSYRENLEKLCQAIYYRRQRLLTPESNAQQWTATHHPAYPCIIWTIWITSFWTSPVQSLYSSKRLSPVFSLNHICRLWDRTERSRTKYAVQRRGWMGWWNVCNGGILTLISRYENAKYEYTKSSNILLSRKMVYYKIATYENFFSKIKKKF